MKLIWQINFEIGSKILIIMIELYSTVINKIIWIEQSLHSNNSDMVSKFWFPKVGDAFMWPVDLRPFRFKLRNNVNIYKICRNHITYSLIEFVSALRPVSPITCFKYDSMKKGSECWIFIFVTLWASKFEDAYLFVIADLFVIPLIPTVCTQGDKCFIGIEFSEFFTNVSGLVHFINVNAQNTS